MLKQTLMAIKGLFGIDDLNGDTYSQLSRAIANSRRPGWYRHVMKEKANIAVSILDAQITEVDRELFAPVMRLDHYIIAQSRRDLASLEEETGISDTLPGRPSQGNADHSGKIRGQWGGGYQEQPSL